MEVFYDISMKLLDLSGNQAAHGFTQSCNVLFNLSCAYYRAYRAAWERGGLA